MSSTPVPPPRRRAPQAERSVALIEALSRWQRAAGPFWPYVCAAPFLGEITVPTVRSGSSAMSDAFAARVTQLVEDAPDSMAAIYADVSPEMALAASGQLSAQQIATVPVIQRWVIDQARVPCG
ncbi:MAG: hypothetical protein QOF51_3561, partial [Chloroflexota bacterium]|nr:hypothetical protein [Chloroflexota bacterium]